jgi:hypothetical protein
MVIESKEKIGKQTGALIFLNAFTAPSKTIKSLITRSLIALIPILKCVDKEMMLSTIQV